MWKPLKSDVPRWHFCQVFAGSQTLRFTSSSFRMWHWKINIFVGHSVGLEQFGRCNKCPMKATKKKWGCKSELSQVKSGRGGVSQPSATLTHTSCSAMEGGTFVIMTSLFETFRRAHSLHTWGELRKQSVDCFAEVKCYLRRLINAPQRPLPPPLPPSLRCLRRTCTHAATWWVSGETGWGSLKQKRNQTRGSAEEGSGADGLPAAWAGLGLQQEPQTFAWEVKRSSQPPQWRWIHCDNDDERELAGATTKEHLMIKSEYFV